MSRNSGVANFDVSATGDLVYIPGPAVGGARTLHWVDRSGRAEQLPLPPRSYLHPRLSPDATRLAIEVEGSDHNVYMYDFRIGVLSNITTDGVSHWPVWSPDGRRIGYRSGPMGRFQLFEVPADRSGPAEQVLGAGILSKSGVILTGRPCDRVHDERQHRGASEGCRGAARRRSYAAASRRVSLRAGFTEVLARRPASRGTARMNRVARKSTFSRFQAPAQRSKSLPKVARIRPGGERAASCSSGTATA